MTGRTVTKPLLLVTGSSGLIGTRLLEELASRLSAVGLDVNEPEDAPQGVSFIHCDLTDDASVAQALGRVRAGHGDRIASVLHLAAYYDFSGEPSPLYGALTVEGTGRLMRHLRAFASVEQVVFSSSLLAMKPVEDGEAVASAVAPHGVRVDSLAVREVPRSGAPEQLLDRYGIGADTIARAVRADRGAARSRLGVAVKDGGSGWEVCRASIHIAIQLTPWPGGNTRR